MFRRVFLCAAMLLTNALTPTAKAAEAGLVINQNQACAFFMLKTPKGLTLVKANQPPPSNGTHMQSDAPMRERDFATLKTPDGTKYRVWVDLLDRSIASVIQEYHKQCDA